MFLIMAIIIIGGSYLFYRYKSVTNKKRFFSSPIYKTAVSSFFILFAAFLTVNIFFPEKSADVEITTEESSDDIDTSFQFLSAQDTRFHYELITDNYGELLFIDKVSVLEKNYTRMSNSNDPHLASVGNFCLGVLTFERDTVIANTEYYFNKITDNQLPFLHFYRGLISLNRDSLDAEQEFQAELQLENGARYEPISYLSGLYFSSEPDYEKLHALMKYPEAAEVFGDALARSVLFKTSDFAGYTVWLLNSIVGRTSGIGFIAAFLIAMMWLIYIFRLDIFRPEKFISLFLFFVAGMFSVILVFFLNDSASLFVEWSITGAFFNDLFYSIIMIGIPEEFAKVLPLFILVLFGKNIKEPIDYIIYGGASALGFAFVENLIYFQEVTSGIIHGRAYFSVIGHVIDTSFVAYGFVIAKFQFRNKKNTAYVVLLSFLAACFVHGVYDLLLFQRLTFLFYIFFILIVQFWVIAVNNCMNNSTHFNYRIAPRAERSRLYITMSLTAVFALEYIYVAFVHGSDGANHQLFANSGFAGLLIIFFSSNLSSFNLVKGYWRNVRTSHAEKRGYGGRGKMHPMISWYFINAVQAHNYVGLRVKISNDPHNKILGEVIEGEHTGKIVDRIILNDENGQDSNWFIVKLTDPIRLAYDLNDYILVKPRYNEDSLLFEDEIEIYFKGIPDIEMLKQKNPDKKLFPFYGWAYMALGDKPMAAKERHVMLGEHTK